MWRKSHIKYLTLRALEGCRRFLLSCHGHPSKGIMDAGVPCNVEDPTGDITHGDVVHPCVKFIEEGFEGHQWWMVYTPFYAECQVVCANLKRIFADFMRILTNFL